MNNQLASHSSDFNFNKDLKQKGFIVFEIENGENIVKSYNRKDFYKICLVSGKNIVNYADKGYEIYGTTLFFGTPYIPYSWEIVSKEQNGYSCLFTEEFLKTNNRSESLQQSPLFKIGGTPIFSLNDDQRVFISGIFKKMISEQGTDYVFKNDLMENYINLIIHEALKMQPSDNFFKHKNASSRITSLFFDLLERQFPIENQEQPLQLKTAHDFAERLFIHVNHLNRSVKDVTGKPTSAHIAARIVNEAKALLQHTTWSISDIAYGLGFEYPTYFNNFFKKMTGNVPKSFRL